MNKFKRFIPIFCLIVVLAGYLVAQFAFQHGNSNANLSSEEKKANSHYESIFQESIFKSFNGLNIDLKKEKAPIVILNFWASWCKPCLDEFSSLIKLRKRYSVDQVKIIAINTDVEKQKMEII